MAAIRHETRDDGLAVREVNELAFGQPAEANLVDKLRQSCGEALSLVAVDEAREVIVGHILFTPVVVESDGRRVVGMGLGPMAVHPDCQRQGIGAKLVRHGLAMLAGRNCPFVVVVGHAAYYPRFGFEPASRHRLASQWDGMRDEAFMVAILDQPAMTGVGGVARYRSEFDEVECSELPQITIRDAGGRNVVARFRGAVLEDVPAIARLIALSARSLSREDYSEDQIEAALGTALGVDSQLIADATYFVAEVDAALVACGGWSRRKTLFGSDAQSIRHPELLDPTRDAARIRAFFVHPDWARRGLGRATLELCESEARRSGFSSAELMATLPGVRLYRSCGYASRAAIEHTLPGGMSIRFVPMRKDFTRVTT